MPEQCAYRMTSQLDDVEQWYVSANKRVLLHCGRVERQYELDAGVRSIA